MSCRRRHKRTSLRDWATSTRERTDPTGETDALRVRMPGDGSEPAAGAVLDGWRRGRTPRRLIGRSEPKDRHNRQTDIFRRKNFNLILGQAKCTELLILLGFVGWWLETELKTAEQGFSVLCLPTEYPAQAKSFHYKWALPPFGKVYFADGSPKSGSSTAATTPEPTAGIAGSVALHDGRTRRKLADGARVGVGWVGSMVNALLFDTSGNLYASAVRVGWGVEDTQGIARWNPLTQQWSPLVRVWEWQQSASGSARVRRDRRPSSRRTVLVRRHLHQHNPDRRNGPRQPSSGPARGRVDATIAAWWMQTVSASRTTGGQPFCGRRLHHRRRVLSPFLARRGSPAPEVDPTVAPGVGGTCTRPVMARQSTGWEIQVSNHRSERGLEHELGARARLPDPHPDLRAHQPGVPGCSNRLHAAVVREGRLATAARWPVGRPALENWLSARVTIHPGLSSVQPIRLAGGPFVLQCARGHDHYSGCSPAPPCCCSKPCCGMIAA